MPRHCAQPPCPSSIQLLSTVHQHSVTARILASLTVFLMMLCSLSLDAYISLQRTTFQFSQAELGICAAQWTNLTQDTEYSKIMSALSVYIPRVSTRSIGMSLTRPAWVKLNHLCTGIGHFNSSMHKWGLAPSVKCKCGTSKQTADHIILTCPLHQAPQGIMSLTVLDDKIRCWLNSIAASI